ncbi:GH116 family glycosyl hydrolase [Candidatus Riflebacteria bacterium]
MKKINFFLILYLFLPLICCAGEKSELNLLKGWQVMPDPENKGFAAGWHFPKFKTRAWKVINAGEAWEKQGFAGYDGIFWYRQWQEIPQYWQGKPVFILFGGVDDGFTLYLNGKESAEFGSRAHGKSFWNQPAFVDISGLLQYGKKNLICVRVNDWGGNGGIIRKPVLISTDISRYLTCAQYFKRAKLSPEEQKLRDILLPPKEYRIGWYLESGLLQSFRKVGFVESLEYCQKTAPFLKSFLKHRQSSIRLWAALRLVELRRADGFEILLNALEHEPLQHKRGSTGYYFEQPGIADRIIKLTGTPDGYDPAGSRALRDSVIEGWRERYAKQGKAMFKGLQEPVPVPGIQTLAFFEPPLLRKMPDMHEFFVISSPRIYEIGSMDGSFPPVGRLLGAQSGLWAPPIKLLDGFEFEIFEKGHAPIKLEKCRDFSNDFYRVKFNYTVNDLKVIRTDFTAEEDPIFYTNLQITNQLSRTREIKLNYGAFVNIRPSWGTGLDNGLDIIRQNKNIVEAYDPDMQKKHKIIFGSEVAFENFQQKRNHAKLSYKIQLPAKGITSINFLVAAIPNTVEGKNYLKTKLSQADDILSRKKKLYHEKINLGVSFNCSDENVSRAFVCAKANLKLLEVELKPYFKYPFLYGGVPDYVQLFGCDSFYSTAGAAASGFVDIARGTLLNLAHFTEMQKGRVPHEIIPTAKVTAPGNIQETPQFIAACWKYFLWTKDRAFLDRIYPLCKKSLEFALQKHDSDGDLYPEGYGIMEVHGMNQENIDAACYVYEALITLEQMARLKNEHVLAWQYKAKAKDLKTRFNQDWWNSEQKMWADSIAGDKDLNMAGHWGVNIPMETKISSPDKARKVLKTVHTEWVNKWHFGGMVPAKFSTCPFHNNIVSNAAFNYGQTRVGWERLKLTSRVACEFGMLGALENLVQSPDDTLQLWSVGPFLEAIISGLVGVKPEVSPHQVELYPQLPVELSNYELNNLKIGSHIIDFSWKRRGHGNRFTIFHKVGTEKLKVLFRIATKHGRTILQDGQIVKYEKKNYFGVDTGKLNFSILPATRLTIDVR